MPRKSTRRRTRKSPFVENPKPRVDLRLARGSITEVEAQALVLGVFEGVQELSRAGRAVDARMEGAISEISLRRMFLGRVGEIFILPAAHHDLRTDFVVCAGMGVFDKFKPAVLQIVAENVARTLVRGKVRDFATVLFGASRGNLYNGLANLVDGFFQGVRGTQGRNPLRSITLCETDLVRCDKIERAVARLYGTRRSRHVDVTLQKINLPEPPDRDTVATPSVVLQTTQLPSAANGRTRIRFSVLGTGDKSTVLSETKTIDVSLLDKLVAQVDGVDFVDNDTLAALKRYGKRLAGVVVPAKIARVLRKIVGKQRMVLIQDAGTSRIPWETLCIDGWFPALEGGMSRQYITDRMPVARWLQERSYGVKIDVLLIVNPTNDLDGAEFEGDIVRQAVGGLAGISIKELRGGAATKARVKRELQSGKYDVLHYAGHTAFYPDSPADTGIVCTRGVLSGNELTRIRNLPAVVLFNSCESARIGGLTQKRGARGLARNVGLAEAFLRGGVANYVGTHWVVSDTAAPAFMTAFYGALLNGESMGTAVADGRQAVRKVGSRDWADYIHYGSPAFVLKVPHGKTTR